MNCSPLSLELCEHEHEHELLPSVCKFDLCRWRRSSCIMMCEQNGTSLWSAWWIPAARPYRRSLKVFYVVLLKDLCVTCVACANCFFDSSSENEKKRRKEIMAKPVCLIAWITFDLISGPSGSKLIAVASERSAQIARGNQRIRLWLWNACRHYFCGNLLNSWFPAVNWDCAFIMAAALS